MLVRNCFRRLAVQNTRNSSRYFIQNQTQRTFNTTNKTFSHSFSYKIPLTIIGATGLFTFFTQTFYASQDETESQLPVEKTLDVSGIRTLRSPESIFKAYASIEKDGQKFMTTADFLRVITPYESMESYDTSSFEGDLTTLLQSIDIDSDGLINYAEFIYFTTFLSIPPKYSKIAFRMFDTDSSGDIDVEEFKSMMRLISQSNPITSTTELRDIFDGTANGGFPAFFGKDGDKCLSFDKFYMFIKQLRDEVATVQFKMIAKGDDTISAQEYAMSLISYGSSRNNPANVARVSQLQSSPIRISIEEYKAFLKVLESLDEIDFILRSFVSVGEPFSKEQLKRAAKAVSQVELSDNVLEVVFFVFDTSGDGKLDDREFIGTLQGHNQFGFTKPKDAGFIRFGKCMRYCWHEEISDRSAKAI